ncbi:MAG: Zn-dependent oligopeptidase [Gammaproteobacteria bacterium]|nr:Zn-dependent oligopeptidase [Gammaproteobacteria bacterium]
MVLSATALPYAAVAEAPADDSVRLHVWEAGDDPPLLETWFRAHLQSADEAVRRLLAVKGARTVANTLRPFDEAVNELSLATLEPATLYGVGLSKELRDKAQALTESGNAAFTALSLNQPVYRALAGIPPPGDGATRHYLERTLLEYRLAGVDRDDATRAKVKALQERITAVGLTFERAVHDDVRTVVADKDELEGLPPDYLAAHPADAAGKVRITTDPPDLWPAQKFARSAALRRRLFLAATSVAWPANDATLRALLTGRAELAQLLGYATWADYAMADLMMGSPAKLRAYLEQVDAASREAARREDSALLAFAREQDPALAQISYADRTYWQEQFRRARFNFDSQSVRPYFAYAQVERGVIATASKLFHVTITPVAGVRTWHPSVTTYDVYDDGHKARLGRVYLDMHPREGKSKWFTTQQLVPGIRGRQLPEGVLVCNFPGGSSGEPGLMEYDDVVIFLHEFGHLMHQVIGGHTAFAGQNALAAENTFGVEWDFVEAPSQMLEEFFRDYGVLSSFARHYQTGEVLPQELYARMSRADTYGRASGQQRQLAYATLSLDVHTLPPATLDFDELYRRDSERFSSSAFVPGDHRWAALTHLNGYSSNYYTYVLDKVIALDFFAQFAARDLLGGPAGKRYARTVLAPGATRPAAQLARDFLGRDPNLDAYRRWLLEEFAPATSSSSAR